MILLYNYGTENYKSYILDSIYKLCLENRWHMPSCPTPSGERESMSEVVEGLGSPYVDSVANVYYTWYHTLHGHKHTQPEDIITGMDQYD